MTKVNSKESLKRSLEDSKKLIYGLSISVLMASGLCAAAVGSMLTKQIGVNQGAGAIGLTAGLAFIFMISIASIIHDYIKTKEQLAETEKLTKTTNEQNEEGSSVPEAGQIDGSSSSIVSQEAAATEGMQK